MPRFQYYRSQILKLMSSIEKKTGKLLHEGPAKEFEAKFFSASDEKNIHKLMVIYNNLAKILDNINSK